VSILATRVGQIATAPDDGKRTCWRCGCRFQWADRNLVPDAPCSDCRDLLRAEGDETIWDTRRLRRLERQKAAA
jgi:hypothetical protein